MQALVTERVGWPDQRLSGAVDTPCSERPSLSPVLVRQSWAHVLP